MLRMTKMVIKVGIGKAAVLTSPAVDGRTLCHRRTCTSKLWAALWQVGQHQQDKASRPWPQKVYLTGNTCSWLCSQHVLPCVCLRVTWEFFVKTMTLMIVRKVGEIMKHWVGVYVILPGTRGQSLLAGPWLVEVQFNIVCPSQSYLMIFLRIYLMILPRPPSRLAWNWLVIRASWVPAWLCYR